MSSARHLRPAIAGLAALACLGCNAEPGGRAERSGRLAAEFSHLSDETFRKTVTCSFIEPDVATRILVVSAFTNPSNALPDDIVITDIEATSDAGWTYRAVAVVGEEDNVPLEDFPDTSSSQIEYEILDLPFTWDRSLEFGLGVVVEVPADTDDNPPAAINITGARYESGGESHFWKFERELYASRRPLEDPAFCERTANLDDDLNPAND